MHKTYHISLDFTSEIHQKMAILQIFCNNLPGLQCGRAARLAQSGALGATSSTYHRRLLGGLVDGRDLLREGKDKSEEKP